MAERHISEYVLDWVDSERQMLRALDKLPCDHPQRAQLQLLYEEHKRHLINTFAAHWLMLDRLCRIARDASPQSSAHEG